MDRGVFKAILLAAVLLGLTALALAVFQPFLVALLWATVLVTATDRIHTIVLRRTGNRKSLAATIMTLLVLFAIITPCALCAITALGEATEFVQAAVPAIEQQVADPDSSLRRGHAWLEKKLKAELDVKRLPEVLFKSGTGTFALGVARATLESILATFAGLFFLILSLFYLYRDGHITVHVAKELIPLKVADRDLVFSEMRDAINAAVIGGLLTAIAQGTLGTIILLILDINGAVFWGTVMALASLIPMVGTALVWIPIACYLAWHGRYTSAIVLISYGVVVIGMADNLLRPILVGQRMKAHSLLLFFGILGSMLLFGFKGIVLGPIVVAGLTATTTLFRREFARKTAKL